MTKEEFKNSIMKLVDNRPKDWRKGQAVFNYIDSEYHVARLVQFKDGIDCFYNDNTIDNFIDCAYNQLKEYNESL